MARFVRVVNGAVQLVENGTCIRVFSSNIVSASTDGDVIAAVNKNGNLEIYNSNASLKYCICTGAVSVQVAGGVVAAQKPDGTIEEYVNGSLKRKY